MGKRTIRHEKRSFKKGERIHLDSVYMIMGIFPDNDEENPFWYQSDIADFNKHERERINSGCGVVVHDAGEYIYILRNFSIEFKIVS